ncbi:MAG: hypothetical protein ACM3SY_12395 [Candidatus Omnitrophota bacterium]
MVRKKSARRKAPFLSHPLNFLPSQPLIFPATGNRQLAAEGREAPPLTFFIPPLTKYIKIDILVLWNMTWNC